VNQTPEKKPWRPDTSPECPVGRAGPRVRFADRTSCAPDTVICATGYRPGLERLAGHLVTLDEHGLPYTGAVSSPQHPALRELKPLAGQ